MTESENTTIRQVGDMLVASIRFRGEYDEVPQRFEKLYEQVKPYMTGKGMLLHNYFDESVGAGHDLEVCCPVSQPVETDEVKSRVLEGGQMLCALHVGPPGKRGEPGSISDVWQKVWGYARQHDAIPDCVPSREVYLEDAQEHGDNTAQYVTELQLAYTFYRMKKLAENLEYFAGEAVRREVMAGSERFPQLWEGILGQPVRIEVLKSVLQGDDRCTFAIHLPQT